jgi:serine/threonine-protein kinase
MGNCMATPAYAAPEQLAGEPITVSADLYALGVLLHELLTGRRPYRDNRRASPDRTEPGRASSRIEEGHAPTVGGIDTQKLRRALLGDLDAIIAKALEVDPANRYSTAEAFAMDLKRSRENRPITARRISAGMLTLKFVRRHRVGVAMSAVLLLTLVGASGLVAWQAVRAEREAQRATTIKDFLIGVFRASDPRIASDKPRGEITARELLDVSSKQIESAFTTQQGTQVELLGVIAEIYGELNETKRSSSLYERESALASKLPGVGDGQVIDGLIGRAYNAETAGDDAKALAILDVADPLILRAHLDKTALRARWLTIRAEALWPNVGKNDEVLVDLEKAVSLFESVAPTDTQYPVALGDLGALQLERGNYQAAAGHYQKAVSTSLPEGSLLLAYHGLANSLRYLGDFKGASAAFEHGMSIAERTYGRKSRLYWAIDSDWAQFRYERGDRVTALAAFETLLQYIPKDRPSFDGAFDMLEGGNAIRKFGYCLAIDGQGDRAVNLLRKAEFLLKSSDPHPVDLPHFESDLGLAYAVAGKRAEAEKTLLHSIELRKALPDQAPQLAIAHEYLGRIFLSADNLEAATSEFTQAITLSDGRASEAATFAQAGLAAVAIAQNDAKAADKASSAAMSYAASLDGYYDVRVMPYLWQIRARALLLGGDMAGAQDLANNALRLTRRYYDTASTEMSRAEDLVRVIESRALPGRQKAKATG